MATVKFTADAGRQAESLPRTIRVRLLALIERLGKWPQVSGVKALRGNLVGFYRIRTGDYRLQFRVEGDEVIVVKVGHRDEFYEE